MIDQATDAGPIPAALRAPSLVVVMCLSCDRLAANGYWIADGRHFLCDDCAGDVTAAYAEAHRLEVHQPTEEGEVSVRVLFSPSQGAGQLEATITPDPRDAAHEIDLLELAAVGLCAYLESYISAMRAEDEPPAGEGAHE
jgi:hypothetical protein